MKDCGKIWCFQEDNQSDQDQNCYIFQTIEPLVDTKIEMKQGSHLLNGV